MTNKERFTHLLDMYRQYGGGLIEWNADFECRLDELRNFLSIAFEGSSFNPSDIGGEPAIKLAILLSDEEQVNAILKKVKNKAFW